MKNTKLINTLAKPVAKPDEARIAVNPVDPNSYVDSGDVRLTQINEMNIPVNVRINPPNGDCNKWRLNAANFCPRLYDDGRCGGQYGAYHVEADTREILVALVQQFIVPRYDIALNELKTTGALYYWEVGEESQSM